MIALATHSGETTPSADEGLILAALDYTGIRAEVVPWDVPEASWGRYDAVLIRSTWNYHLRLSEFLAWADRVEAEGATLWNPPSVVRWNADKRYLRELERAGVLTVPTEWIPRGTVGADLGALLRRRGWERAVVKPSVAATAYRTWVVEREGAEVSGNLRLLSGLLADAHALVQPFLEEIDSEGEWSFLFFADEAERLTFSHSVLKRPAAGDFRVQTQFGGTAVPATAPGAVLRQVEEIARVVCRLAPGPLLYARIDGVVSGGVHAPHGSFLLLEAELIEPMLFLEHSDSAAARLAEAIARGSASEVTTT
jgi:glutathione synthase/RimK-type ligase-like ATP-grasp enzyme